MAGLTAILIVCAAQWRHPAGLITQETIGELRAKAAGQAWAQRVYGAQRKQTQEWAAVPLDKLRAVFPTKRSNVYHNFSCPDDRTRLKFDPFNATAFVCGTYGKTFDPATDAGVYPKDGVYHGTMYDGWACLFYQASAAAAAELALIGRLDGNEAFVARGRELLRLYANTIRQLPTDMAGTGQSARILTYHREGDNKVLNDLAAAYELIQDKLTAEERTAIERDVLRRMIDDVIFEPINHNNLYQWHRTAMQTGAALEREDLIDWAMGYGEHAPDKKPDHFSIRKALASHFKPDGAYWELCSGYHLYPLTHLCELAFLSRNLSRMDPARFPPELYDLTSERNPGQKVIKNALEWFMSMAMPDRTMPTVGDSMSPRAGMADYTATAEIGYRFYGLDAVGDYDTLRRNRSWIGLL